MRFDCGIRSHLEMVCGEAAPAFNPGDVFAYLNALDVAGALGKAVADRVEIVEERIPEDLNLAQGKLDELKRLFKLGWAIRNCSAWPPMWDSSSTPPFSLPFVIETCSESSNNWRI